MQILDDMFKIKGHWDPKALGWSLLAWLMLIATYITSTMISVVHGDGHRFDMQSFGVGAGTLLAGGGLGVLWHGKSSSGSGDMVSSSANSQSDSGNAAGLNGG